MAIFSGAIRSSTLNMNTGLSVVLPYDRPAKDQQTPCKTLFLLHGMGGDNTSWTRHSNVERYARDYGFALIIPEVQKSFYTDMQFGVDYFKYITEELPEICAQMFNISLSPEDTYIAGLSMGGYGALKCALSYPEKYAACAAFSALTDLNYLVGQAKEIELENEVKALFGTELCIPKESDLKYLAKQAISTKDLPRFYIACGEQDYLYSLNQTLAKYLKDISFPHKFEHWQGEHDWYFWDTAIQKALSFFAE